MIANQVCGKILTREEVKSFFKFMVPFHKTITRALASDAALDWSSQTASMWDIDSSSNVDPQQQAMVDNKRIIASHHVTCLEAWKDIKYRDVRKWPESTYQSSWWNEFQDAMAENRPLYASRNWFSHEIGAERVTLQQEIEIFEKLLQAYREVLPMVEGLMGKLKAALEDELAWIPWDKAQARNYNLSQPPYTYECEAVLQYIKQKEEERAARWEEEERLEQVRSARMGGEEWVYTEVEGEEWGEDEGGQDVEWAKDTQGDTCDDEDQGWCSESDEDLSVDDSGADSDYDDSVVVEGAHSRLTLRRGLAVIATVCHGTWNE